jgi:hypothetical protein
MEILLVLLVSVGIFFYIYRKKIIVSNLPLSKITEHDVPTATPMPESQSTTVVEAVKDTIDVNKDGKIDLADAKEAVKKSRAKFKKAADLNNDNSVTVKDVKIAASRARKSVEKAASKVTGTVKAMASKSKT